MKTLIDILRKEIAVIKQTPWSFAIVVVVVCGLMFAFLQRAYEWRYRSQIELKDSEIEALKEKTEHVDKPPAHLTPEQKQRFWQNCVESRVREVYL